MEKEKENVQETFNNLRNEKVSILVRDFIQLTKEEREEFLQRISEYRKFAVPKSSGNRSKMEL